MKKLFKYYFSRVIIISLLLFIQLAAILACCCTAFFCFDRYFRIVLWLVSIAAAMRIASMPCSIPCRCGWIIGVLALPMVFIPLYTLYGRGGAIRKIRSYLKNNPLPKSTAHPENYAPPRIARQFTALAETEGFSSYCNSVCVYLATGEAMFEKMKSILERAERYIFIEMFIISQGEMWNKTLEILKKKAAQGVSVYLLRDDLGTICLLPKDFDRQMKNIGVESRKFNSFSPTVTPDINYRDHRKIVVCDGLYAITGGANIADEYINLISPYGYWKDSAVYLKGEGAMNLADMFIQLWNMNGGKLDYNDFLPEKKPEIKADGLVMPFGDYPSCTAGSSLKAFVNMINGAEKSVYATTPYLIPDPSLTSALCRAAENGVDVRIITPLIPDKKYIHLMTRANYLPLLRSGVKIYEYTPGFIHSKTLICDGNICYIGSANLDYRSLYLHFESGVLTYGTNACKELSEDFEELFKCSEEMSLNDKAVIKASKNPIYRFLRIFSGIL